MPVSLEAQWGWYGHPQAATVIREGRQRLLSP